MKKFRVSQLLLLIAFIGISISACKKDDLRPRDEGPAGSSGEEITLYKVDGDQIIKVKDFDVKGAELELQKDVQKHQEIWNLVKKIVPLSHRSKMSDFLIYAGANSGTAGFVVETNADLSKWKMGIAIDIAYDGGFNAGNELSYTIIHEFGHILTLDNTQLDASVSQNDCANYYPGEGCARSNSYINKLFSNYWAGIHGEHQDAMNEGDDALRQFYDKYQSHFVTDYAATNPGEDIAEVFAFFVTKPDRPSGNAVSDQKINLLYDHPELVTLRNEIRNNLAGFGKNRSLLPTPGSWKRAHSLSTHTKCNH